MQTIACSNASSPPSGPSWLADIGVDLTRSANIDVSFVRESWLVKPYVAPHVVRGKQGLLIASGLTPVYGIMGLSTNAPNPRWTSFDIIFSSLATIKITNKNIILKRDSVV